MAHHLNFFQLLIVAILTTFNIAATSTSPTPTNPSVIMPMQPSVADKAFLRARCATTKNATTCYSTLLPFAGSFNGSQIKISSAATAVAFRRLRDLLTELQRLQAAGGTGAGSRGDQALADCAVVVEVGTEGEQEALSYLRTLESSASKEEKDTALFWTKARLSSAGSSSEGCIDNFEDAGEPALSSNVGKKVIAMSKNTDEYIDIAIYLVVGITL